MFGVVQVVALLEAVLDMFYMRVEWWCMIGAMTVGELFARVVALRVPCSREVGLRIEVCGTPPKRQATRTRDED